MRLFDTLQAVTCQAPLSMGFSRQEYWSRLPSPSPGDLPNPGIKLGSPALQADSLPSEQKKKKKQESRYKLEFHINERATRNAETHRNADNSGGPAGVER